ncbi:MAG TPA: CbiX/SirB N-terminal domain-containing protein, partial [Noviherbaspirillum sp.]
MKNALILFAHGARDPRWAAPFEKLRDIARAQLPDTDVSLAFLELMTPRLPEVVARLAGEGCT